MPFLRKPFMPRRRVTLLEKTPGSGQRTFTATESRATIEYRSGGIRSSALGAVEASVESVVITIPRNRHVEEGWRVRDQRDGREYEVRFRQPLSDAESITRLQCRYLSGVVSRVATLAVAVGAFGTAFSAAFNVA